MEDPPASRTRRGFLKLLNAAIGTVIGAVFAIPGARFLIFPASAGRRIVKGSGGFVPVAAASAVGDKPLRVEITAAEQRDAWSRLKDVTLGAAWLVRGKDGHIRAFTTACPHLGCAIDFDAATDTFRCPCHQSTYALSGERLSGPTKRGMDPLAIEIDADGQVSLRYRRFKPDIAEREEV